MKNKLRVFPFFYFALPLLVALIFTLSDASKAKDKTSAEPPPAQTETTSK